MMHEFSSNLYEVFILKVRINCSYYIGNLVLTYLLIFDVILKYEENIIHKCLEHTYNFILQILCRKFSGENKLKLD